MPNLSRRVLPSLLVALLALCLPLAGCSGDEEARAQPGAGGGAQPEAPANPLEQDSALEDPEAAPEPATSDPFGGGEDLAGNQALAGDVPDVAGGWTGSVTDETGEEGGFQLSLQQDGAAVTGSAILTTNGGQIPLNSLSGTVDDTGALQLRYNNVQEQQDTNISGTVDGETISGEFVLTSVDETGAQDTDTATFFLNRASAQ